MITSYNNKSVREVIQLGQKAKARNKAGLFVVEGMKMFAEAPADRIEKVYVAQRAQAGLWEQYGDRLGRLSCEIVADEVFDKMSDTKTPQGILCLVRQFHYNIEEMLTGKRGKIYISSMAGKEKNMGQAAKAATEKGKKQMLFILLEDLQDPGNLGTIFRVGEGAGIDGIIMSSKTVDVYNPKVIRSTMGSVYRVPFLYVEDLRAVARMLQEQGVGVYAADLAGAKDYDEFDYVKGTAFLVGNEASGLREATAACADGILRIPMEGKVESLNAAVASSILLYEAYRQRRKVVLSKH